MWPLFLRQARVANLQMLGSSVYILSMLFSQQQHCEHVGSDEKCGSLVQAWRRVCIPRPARWDAKVAGEAGPPPTVECKLVGAALGMLLTTAGEPGPRSMRLSSVASFSICWQKERCTVASCRSWEEDFTANGQQNKSFCREPKKGREIRAYCYVTESV